MNSMPNISEKRTLLVGKTRTRGEGIGGHHNLKPSSPIRKPKRFLGTSISQSKMRRDLQSRQDKIDENMKKKTVVYGF